MEASITGSVVLSAEATSQLQREKREQRINNEMYFRAHPELRTMLSSFVSTLLRERPDDANLFAETFFTDPELAHKLGLSGWSRPATPEAPDADADADEYLAEGGEEVFAADGDFEEGDLEPETDGTTQLNAIELENLLVELFKEADKDGSGTLDASEFAELLATANLGLSSHELKLLLAESDYDSDGKVSYDEFVPIAVEIIQTMLLKERVQEYNMDMNDELRFAAEQIIGMSASEVEALVHSAAAKPEVGETLTRAQVKALLKSPVLGISRQQVSAAVSKLAFDGKAGTISVAALGGALHEVLIEVVAYALAVQNLGALGEELERILAQHDREESGRIDLPIFKSVLANSYPYLTRTQINAICSDSSAPLSEEGQLAWREFLPQLTTLLKAMGDPAAIAERAEMIARAEITPVQLLTETDRAKVEDMLKANFAAADKDGNGYLDADEFTGCLRSADLGLGNRDIALLLQEFDTDGDGRINLAEFTQLAFDVIAGMTRERTLIDAINAADGYAR